MCGGWGHFIIFITVTVVTVAIDTVSLVLGHFCQLGYACFIYVILW